MSRVMLTAAIVISASIASCSPAANADLNEEQAGSDAVWKAYQRGSAGCSDWNTASRSCTSVSRVRVVGPDDLTLDTVRLSPDGRYKVTYVTSVTRKNGELCSIVDQMFVDSFRFYLNDDSLSNVSGDRSVSENVMAGARGVMMRAIAPDLGKEFCARYVPGALNENGLVTDFVARTFYNGVEQPAASGSPMLKFFSADSDFLLRPEPA